MECLKTTNRSTEIIAVGDDICSTDSITTAARGDMRMCVCVSERGRERLLIYLYTLQRRISMNTDQELCQPSPPSFFLLSFLSSLLPSSSCMRFIERYIPLIQWWHADARHIHRLLGELRLETLQDLVEASLPRSVYSRMTT